MSDPTVSVIIPTYNRSQAVGEAIASVLCQEPAPLEVIVIDDGSTDETPTTLATYADQIRVIKKANGGAASARNAGIAAAKGDWLAFLDSDDLWLAGRMKTFHRDISNASDDIVAHIADVIFSNTNGSLFTNDLADYPSGSAKRLIDPFDAHIPGPLLQASVLRAHCVANLGGFSEDLPIHEDTLLFRRLALMGDWLVTGDAVAQYRRVDGDAVALMDWEQAKPIPFFSSRVHANTRLLKDQRLQGERRAQVKRDQSGAYFLLAGAYAKKGEGALSRQALMDSVRSFPRPKTIARAMLAGLFGKSAYGRIVDQEALSLHPNRATSPQNQTSR